MDPMVWTYIGFVVAALILIWAALEFRSRLTRFHNIEDKRRNIWIKLDPTQPGVRHDEPLPLPSMPEDDAAEQEENPLHDMQLRAKQNGHHTGSKYPL
jgi:hypothetical protein